jgi:hypothetical protein
LISKGGAGRLPDPGRPDGRHADPLLRRVGGVDARLPELSRDPADHHELGRDARLELHHVPQDGHPVAPFDGLRVATHDGFDKVPGQLSVSVFFVMPAKLREPQRQQHRRRRPPYPRDRRQRLDEPLQLVDEPLHVRLQQPYRLLLLLLLRLGEAALVLPCS